MMLSKISNAYYFDYENRFQEFGYLNKSDKIRR